MTLTVRLPPEEENKLEKTARRLGRSKSDLARQAVHELCLKLDQEEHSAYAMGEDLFDVGSLAKIPADPMKQQIWDILQRKHGYSDDRIQGKKY